MRKQNVVSIKAIILFLLIGFLNVCLAADTDYSAVVLDIAGKALVQQGGKGKEYIVEAGDLLYPGDIVKTEKNSTLTIMYIASNRLEKWPQDKKFTVGKAKTDGVPADVEVKERRVTLPKKETSHRGADIMRAIF